MNDFFFLKKKKFQILAPGFLYINPLRCTHVLEGGVDSKVRAAVPVLTEWASSLNGSHIPTNMFYAHPLLHVPHIEKEISNPGFISWLDKYFTGKLQLQKRILRS